MNRTNLFKAASLLVLLPLIACAEQPTKLKDIDDDKFTKDPDDPIGDTPDKEGIQPEDTVGAEDNTFNHEAGMGEDEVLEDPFTIAARREAEGTPETRARLHSCQKLQITTLRNVLTAFGVDLDATGDPPTAGQLLNGGGTALGQANYAARMGEDIVWTAAGAAKMFDIYVQAAPEIIAAMPNLPQCQIEGVGPNMFEEDGSCNADAVSCLIGRPATADHLAICKDLVDSASSVDNGRNIAVAALLSAAHTCE
jgi:hypothetical protein